jgi:SAM-dependent methyltransferase
MTNEIKEKDESIYNNEDIKKMLDSFLEDSAKWWNDTYLNKDRPLPFFRNVPDENLVNYFKTGQLVKGRALDIGCGPGRNSIYLAIQGCEVDGIDISKEAIDLAIKRANEMSVYINFKVTSIFDYKISKKSYDIIYDHGCLHHIPPHRRFDYIELIKDSLKPKGYLGLVCFAPGGSQNSYGLMISDWDVYKRKSILGGLVYTEDKLKKIFSDGFEIIEFRKMKNMEENQDLFGISDLWAILLKKV